MAVHVCIIVSDRLLTLFAFALRRLEIRRDRLQHARKVIASLHQIHRVRGRYAAAREDLPLGDDPIGCFRNELRQSHFEVSLIMATVAMLFTS